MTQKAMVVALLLMVGTVLVVARNEGATPGAGRVNTVSFTEPIRIGSSVIPAGTYKVLHVMEGQNHTMVFTSKTKGVPEVRVQCKMENLPTRASQDSIVYKRDGSGVAVLSRLIFRGDAYSHNF